MIAEAALAAVLLRAPCTAPDITDVYDRQIQAAVQRYWPAHLHPFWCWWKAQLWSESRLDPRARSPVGALGIAQVMPATGAEQMGILELHCDLREAQCSITIGTAYSGRVARIFTSPRTIFDLLCHEAVAFNAGPGSDLRAQRVAQSESCDAVLAHLHHVTGRHAKETRGYVARIRRTFLRLLEGRS